MSTGLDCRFIEAKDNTWTYRLEQWDRRYEYDTFGPFPSFDKARTHLHAHHANPGGYSIDYAEDRVDA